jgi:hypothetical protein
MTTITLKVPDSLAEYHHDTVRFIAAKLYESGKLSLGQAAEMAGLTKSTFAELLGDYDVSYINYSVDCNVVIIDTSCLILLDKIDAGKKVIIGIYSNIPSPSLDLGKFSINFSSISFKYPAIKFIINWP